MARITYLLGAGASANSIPMVSQIETHLRIFRTYLQAKPRQSGGADAIENYITDIDELSDELSPHVTIDGYARALYQNKVDSNARVKLSKLKSILCGLFLFEQLRKKTIVADFAIETEERDSFPNDQLKQVATVLDPRYTHFIGKVVEQGKLMDGIRILSWNYDLQFEIAIEKNIGYKYDEVPGTCLVYPHPTCAVQDPRPILSGLNDGTPQLVKLNGTAGVFIRKDGFYNPYIDQSEYFEDHIDTILSIHQEVRRYHNFNPFLNFAWERDNHAQKALTYAKQIASTTDILVVIGYSFPDFNLRVDKEIFQSSRISKIFLQVPASDFENIQYNMEGVFPNVQRLLQHRSNLNEFFIPR